MTKKPLRLSFLLALIQEIIVALYPLTENNTVLVGYAFQRFCARDWFNCVQACHDEPGCISYNYERSAGANGLCELNHCGVEELSYRNRLLIYSSGFVYQKIRKGKQCLLKSCREIQQKDPKAKSGARTIQPLPNAKPTKVYCEFDIAGGGFTFLPHSLTFRSDAQQIVDSLFKDKRNVLLKLKTRVNGSESYTWIQPHPNFINKDFGVLVNNFSGYTTPLNRDMGKYIVLRILPKSIAKKSYEMQRFKSNGKIIQFENYGWNPNSLFAFLLNPNGRTCKSYALNLRCKEKDVAAQWRSTAIPVTFPELKMPQEFFFLTELHFGGGGCYISNDRYSKFNATAIGIR